MDRDLADFWNLMWELALGLCAGFALLNVLIVIVPAVKLYICGCDGQSHPTYPVYAPYPAYPMTIAPQSAQPGVPQQQCQTQVTAVPTSMPSA